MSQGEARAEIEALQMVMAQKDNEIYELRQEIERLRAVSGIERLDCKMVADIERLRAEVERLNAVLDGIVNRSTDHQDAMARAKWRALEGR